MLIIRDVKVWQNIFENIQKLKILILQCEVLQSLSECFMCQLKLKLKICVVNQPWNKNVACPKWPGGYNLNLSRVKERSASDRLCTIDLQDSVVFRSCSTIILVTKIKKSLHVCKKKESCFMTWKISYMTVLVADCDRSGLE